MYNFKLHLDNSLNEMDIIEMLAKIELNLNQTTNLINTKNEFMNKIDQLKIKMFNMSKDVLISYQSFLKQEIDFELNLLKEINEKKLDYACCLKNVNFENNGKLQFLNCNKKNSLEEEVDDEYIDDEKDSTSLQSGAYHSRLLGWRN